MRPSVVVEVDPVGDRSAGVLLALESLPMHALLFERSNQALNHAILLR